MTPYEKYVLALLTAILLVMIVYGAVVYSAYKEARDSASTIQQRIPNLVSLVRSSLRA